MLLLRLIAIYNLLCIISSLRYPEWPVDFGWSYKGKIDGYHCLDVTEREETMLNFWDLNFLCVRNDSDLINPQFQWSDQGLIYIKSFRLGKLFLLSFGII